MNHFETLLRLFLILPCTAALAACLYELFRKRRPVAGLYLLLRLAAVFLLFLLIRSLWSDEWAPEYQTRTLVLLEDVSLSMENQTPSLVLRRRQLRDDVLKRCSSSPSFFHYRFAASLLTSGSADSALRRGATSVGEALLSAARLHPGANFLLLTDGASNSGFSPWRATSLLSSAGLSVYGLICSGDALSAGADLACDTASSRTGRDNSITFSVPVIARPGSDGAPLSGVLELLVDGVPVRRQNFSPVPDLTQISWTVPPGKLSLSGGWHEYEFRLLPAQDDSVLSNNSSFGVFEVKNQSRVLALWSGGNAELQALRSVFASRYGSSLDIMYASDFMSLPAAGQCAVLDRASLLILENVPASVFLTPALDLLASKVRSRTLSLIFMTPQAVPSYSAAPLLAGLLPVENISARRTLKTPASVTLDHSPQLPVYSVTGCRVLDSASVVLKTSGDPASALPLVVSAHQISVVLFHGSWRWRLHRDRSVALAYGQFWDCLLDRIDLHGRKGLFLTVSPAGDAAEKHAVLCTAVDFEKDRALSRVVLNLENRDKTLTPLLSLKSSGERTFSAVASISSPGIHWLRASAPSVSPAVLSNRVPVAVVDSSVELTRSTNAPAFLQSLASLSGGRLIDSEHLSALDELLQQRSGVSYHRIQSTSSQHRTRNFLLAVAALVLLFLEWFIRKLEEIRHVE